MLGFGSISDGPIAGTPEIDPAHDVLIPTGLLTLTGFAPTISLGFVIPTGTLSLIGDGPSLGMTMPVPTGHLFLVGQPLVKEPRIMPVPTGFLTFTSEGPLTEFRPPTGFLSLSGGGPFLIYPETIFSQQPGLVVTWMELTDATGAVHVWSTLPLTDPEAYYFGWKDDLVMTWGTLRRALSDEFGSYEGIAMAVTLADVKLTLRALLDNPATKYLMGRPVVIRTIEDDQRRLQQVARTIFKGTVTGYRPGPDLTFEIEMADSLAMQFDLLSEMLIPKRRVTLADFPNANAGWSLVLPDPNNDDGVSTVTGEVGAEGMPVPVIYGEISDTQYFSGVDWGDGQCPYLYVGDENIGGVNWHAFLLAGHACQHIYEIYYSNDPLFLGTVGEGSNWLVPGYPNWTARFGVPYRDINGNRYSIVYGRGTEADEAVAKGAAPRFKGENGGCLSFSVKGIEAIGDGSGTLITDLFEQYLHCLQNWVFGDYHSGRWLPSPVFADEPSVPMIDEDSFRLCSEIAKLRLPETTLAGGGPPVLVPAGYRGDFMLGWSSYDAYSGNLLGGTDTLLTARDLIARFNLCADTRSGFSRKSQYFIRMIDENAVPVGHITDTADILKGSFTIVDDLAHLYNVVPYRQMQDYFNRNTSGWRLGGVFSDPASIAHYSPAGTSQPIIAPTLDMYMIRGANRYQYWQGQRTVEDVVNRFLLKHKDPPRLVSWTQGATGHNYDVGDLVEVTHFAGMSLTGWSRRPIFLLRHDSDLDQRTVTMQGLDVKVFFP